VTSKSVKGRGALPEGEGESFSQGSRCGRGYRGGVGDRPSHSSRKTREGLERLGLLTRLTRFQLTSRTRLASSEKGYHCLSRRTERNFGSEVPGQGGENLDVGGERKADGGLNRLAGKEGGWGKDLGGGGLPLLVGRGLGRIRTRSRGKGARIRHGDRGWKTP